MASIGKLSLLLSADPTGFLGAMDRVKAELKDFGNLVQKPLKFAGGQLGDIGGMFTGLFKFITNPLKPLEAGFESFFDLVGEGSQIQKISAIGKAAQRVGLDAADFGTFMRAAGLEADVAAKLFTRVTNAIHKQGLVADESTVPLENLGLKLDKFKGLTRAQEIEELSRQYQKLSKDQKSAVDVALGGRQFAEFQRLLRRGPEGLAELKAKLGKQGVLFTNEDAERATAAVLAVKELKGSFEGIKTQLAIAFAPLITDIAKGISSWIDKMGGGKAIAQAIAQSFLDAAIFAVQTAQAVAEMVQGIKELADLPRAAGRLGLGADIAALAKGLGGEGAGRKPLDDWLDALRRAKKDINEIGKGLTGGFAGKSFFERMGEQIKDFIKEVERLDKLGDEDLQMWRKRAAEIVEAARSPVEKFGEDIDELAALLAEGAIDVETWGKAAMRAVDQFQGAAGRDLVAGPAALIQGTSAAISAVNAAARGAERTNPFKEAEEILKRQEQLQKDMRGLLQEQLRQAGLANVIPP